MKQFLRILRWLGLSLLVVVVLGVAGLAIYTHTDHFREFARQKLMAVINDSVRGKVSVARIEGSVWGSLTVVDLIVSDAQSEILRLPRATINYSLLPLLWGRVQIFDLEASEPLLSLKKNDNGDWNIVEAFAPLAPQPTEAQPAEPSKLIILLNSLDLRQAAVDLALSGQPVYRLRDLNLRGNAGIQPTGLAVDLDQISSRVLVEGMPEARIQGGFAYQNMGALDAFHVRDLSIESGESRIRFSGKLDDLKKFNTEAKVTVDPLAPADAARFIPDWPIKATIAGDLNVRGPASALNGALAIAVAGGNISGNFKADITAEKPAHQARAKITDVNLATLLGRSDLQGIAGGTLQVSGHGFAPADIAGQAEMTVRSAVAAGWGLGRLSLKTTVAHSVAKVDGQLKSELGQADWQGQIAFKGKPEYEIAFSARQLDIQKISPQGKPLKGSVNFDVRVKGSGLTAAAANADARINIRRSTVGDVNLEQGRLIAVFKDQRIRVSEAFLNAADTTLTAKGEIGMDLKQQGQLDYRLRVESLQRWLELVNQKGSGSLNLTGTVRGNLADLKTQGRLAVNSLRLEGTAVQSGSIDYNLGYASAQGAPGGTLNVNLADVRSGYHLQALEGTVRILPKLPYNFEVDTKARDAKGRTHALTTNVEYAPGRLVARVTQLSLDLPDGTWRLSQPTTLEQREQDFLVDRFSIRNNDRQLSLDGRFSLKGGQSLRMNVDRLPLEAFRGFFPDGPDVAGVLSAQAQLGGTAAAPEMSATAKLDNSKIAGQSYAGLSATASYKNQRADLNATVQQDQVHQLSAIGTVPMALSWVNGWRADAAGNMKARVQSPGLSLAVLNAFSGKAVQAIDGELTMDVQIQGTLKQPLVNGFVRLRNGKLTPTALGVQVSSVNTEALLESKGIRISQLSARAENGELNGSGFIGLNQFSPQDIKLSIAAKRWPAIKTQPYQAELNGSVNVDGTATAPRMTAKLEVIKAEVRPDLSFLDRGNTPTKRDPSISVVSANSAGASPEKKQESEKPPESEMFKNSSFDVQIRLPNNVWVRHPNANAELSGNLKATKAAGGKPAVTGSVETIRGWVGFQGRRFNLSRGRVDFGGSEKINASLDILAEYRVDNYLVHVTINGTIEKPTLTLSSEPQLDQADILSLLLFNKPISALEKGEQASLQQNAVDITTGFAAAKVGEAVSNALGLQNIGDVDFSGGQVRFSRYVGRNTFVSVGQEISGQAGQQASVEYRVTPEWKLAVSSSTKGANGVDLIWHKRY
jgi:autotransporter translocation and assembly factor TamB